MRVAGERGDDVAGALDDAHDIVVVPDQRRPRARVRVHLPWWTKLSLGLDAVCSETGISFTALRHFEACCLESIIQARHGTPPASALLP